MTTITESGMTFGPFEPEHVFHIEKSGLYGSLGEGIKTSEFVLIVSGESPSFWEVEAKSSSPRPNNQNFADFLAEIRDKWVNSLALTSSAILGRHANPTDLPDTFFNQSLGEIGVKLVLVIPGHKSEWLPPLRDALSRELRATIKTWALGPSAVFVLNEEMAVKHGLSQSR